MLKNELKTIITNISGAVFNRDNGRDAKYNERFCKKLREWKNQKM